MKLKNKNKTPASQIAVRIVQKKKTTNLRKHIFGIYILTSYILHKTSNYDSLSFFRYVKYSQLKSVTVHISLFSQLRCK